MPALGNLDGEEIEPAGARRPNDRTLAGDEAGMTQSVANCWGVSPQQRPALEARDFCNEYRAAADQLLCVWDKN